MLIYESIEETEAAAAKHEEAAQVIFASLRSSKPSPDDQERMTEANLHLEKAKDCRELVKRMKQG